MGLTNPSGDGTLQQRRGAFATVAGSNPAITCQCIINALRACPALHLLPLFIPDRHVNSSIAPLIY